ncbi:hypothetical protein TGARI_216053 [Toxoplasma gondii ARI]|uniref:Transmembrane protein n=1 Tax=Toxoplasma gondii ARI TaxID=1074872 RepID=A0A139XKC7_TOXGO|nr:hypothetical protein TGARI_216053 [Toxoplasma gondii ARI]
MASRRLCIHLLIGLHYIWMHVASCILTAETTAHVAHEEMQVDEQKVPPTSLRYPSSTAASSLATSSAERTGADHLIHVLRHQAQTQHPNSVGVRGKKNPPTDQTPSRSVPRSVTSPLAAIINTADLRRAQEAQLEKWLQLAATGAFNDLAWGCLNRTANGSQMSQACVLQWEAQFCIANYLLIDALNSRRRYSRDNWLANDGSWDGLNEMTRLCQPQVYDWSTKRTADCRRAAAALRTSFPPTECVKLSSVSGYALISANLSVVRFCPMASLLISLFGFMCAQMAGA